MAVLSSSKVDQSRHDSDHHPIICTLDLPFPFTHGPLTGTPHTLVRWDPSARARYAASLQAALLLPLPTAGTSPCDVSACFEHLHSVVEQAAGASGMPRRPVTTGKHKPFYDAACQASKRALRRAISHDCTPDERRLLERQYHTLVRRKKRQHADRNLTALLALQRFEPRQFWKRLRSQHSALPPALSEPAAWDAFMQNVSHMSLPLDCSLPLEAYPQVSTELAVHLNADITLDEVSTMLRELHNGRSPGSLGLPAELLRYAQAPPTQDAPAPPHLLTPLLHQILNRAFHAGFVPAEVNSALVTPVLKKGDRALTSNYRPIAVTTPVMRLYAGILNARVQRYTEDQRLRAPSQFGFRPHLSTLHPMFILQHFVDSCQRNARPLFCCFLDLKAAYDRVQRPLLWQVLSRLGVHGKMLSAIQSLYDASMLSISVSGRVGSPFLSCTGVKQGCPLSPTLFGLFLDGLHRYLAVHCPATGLLSRDGTRVRDLQYADDVLLMDPSPDGLQQLISSVAAFTQQTGMLISAQKTEIICFHDPASPERRFVCHGTPLQVVEQAKYLGLQFSASAGLAASPPALFAKQLAAGAILSQQVLRLGATPHPGMQLRAFYACVPPVASYACELWSARALPRAATKAKRQMEAAYVTALRRILTLPPSVTPAIVLAESSSRPISHTWLQRTTKFYNNVLALPADSLCRRILLLQMADASQFGADNWFQSFLHTLSCVQYTYSYSSGSAPIVDEHTLRLKLSLQQQSVFQAVHVCPRSCPPQGSTVCTYANWFHRPTHARAVPVVDVQLPFRKLSLLLRFRCGCHRLPSNLGRRLSVARPDRICPKCAGSFCDEFHLVFECPFLDPIRAQFEQLFHNRCTMRQFMWQPDMVGVANFVYYSMHALLSA